MKPEHVWRPALAGGLALCLAMPAAWAQTPPTAGERESLEALRETTLALIELLVANGTLTREKADQLLAEARRRAAARPPPGPGEWGAPPPVAAAPVVRVPFVPQVVRDQIRNELREEIVARARAERWGVPNATAEWTDRIVVNGDLRVRGQGDFYQDDNLSPLGFVTAAAATLATRAPDLAAATSVGLPTANTEVDRNRSRVRARLGFTARVNDWVTGGLRLATGSSTDRTSTNQTLGQNFNKYSFLVDQAYIRLTPYDWVSASAGRIPNPWFSTDLVWNDSLGFEGAAVTLRRPEAGNSTWLPFATVGYFPVRESAPPRRGRGILGAQVGVQWEASELTRVRVGFARYRFRYFEGQVDGDYSAVTGPGASYGQYEYEAGLRQRGNTLFLTNNPLEIAAGLTLDRARWGLASRFEPWTVTVAAQWSHFAPVFVGLTGEVVRNEGYDRGEIAGRTGGLFLDDARVFGVGGRLTVGAVEVRSQNDWQVTLAYKWLGSDAVPDAFVDSDIGLGGTNVRGLSVGLNYGLARDTALGVRWITGRTISSPTVRGGSGDSFAVDSLQVDLNVRY
ncbi:MAG: putative porin [Rubrivivax sp.]|nr:putative porin [Rubrivivax sp.]